MHRLRSGSTRNPMLDISSALHSSNRRRRRIRIHLGWLLCLRYHITIAVFPLVLRVRFCSAFWFEVLVVKVRIEERERPRHPTGWGGLRSRQFSSVAENFFAVRRIRSRAERFTWTARAGVGRRGDADVRLWVYCHRPPLDGVILLPGKVVGRGERRMAGSGGDSATVVFRVTSCGRKLLTM